jgi:Domain of unknown function (DUF4167)
MSARPKADEEPCATRAVPLVAATEPLINDETSNPMSKRTNIRRSKGSGPRLPKTSGTQNAQQNYQRYLALARAQALSGDPIAAENYLQHAEHYLRSMREAAHGARQ